MPRPALAHTARGDDCPGWQLRQAHLLDKGSTPTIGPTCAPPPTTRPAGCSPVAVAGQPLRAETLAGAIHELGVPAAAGHGAAIRQLVLQAPAPVVAQAFGYHDKTASRLVTEAGGTWSRYAGGDHSR